MTDAPAANPMIAAAIARGEDATGLCTVRELIEAMEHRKHDQTELWFDHNGKHYRVYIQIRQSSKL